MSIRQMEKDCRKLEYILGLKNNFIVMLKNKRSIKKTSLFMGRLDTSFLGQTRFRQHIVFDSIGYSVVPTKMGLQSLAGKNIKEININIEYSVCQPFG